MSLPRPFAALVVLLGLTLPAAARAEPTALPADATPAAPRPRDHVVEFSFAQSQLFIAQSEHDLAEQSVADRGEALPTSAALLLGEWLFSERVAVIGLFNLPLTTQRTVVDGRVLEEAAAPVAALGLRWAVLVADVRDDARLELQLAALGGMTIGSRIGDVIFPLVAGRLHLSKADGFGLFVGTSFAFVRESLALVYGVGHRF